MTGRPAEARLSRHDLMRRLVAKLTHGEAIVGGVGNNNFDLFDVAPDRPQNFYMLGSMGMTCALALGVALTQPARRVFGVEGDGSMLMQLGSLATLAAIAPKNLTILIMDNGIYQSTGGQPTSTAAGVDIAAVARSAGIRRSGWVEDPAQFERAIDEALAADEISLVAARVDPAPALRASERDPIRIRDRFMRGLGALT